jgi:hypothetical protein
MRLQLLFIAFVETLAWCIGAAVAGYGRVRLALKTGVVTPQNYEYLIPVIYSVVFFLVMGFGIFMNFRARKRRSKRPCFLSSEGFPSERKQ